MGRSAPLPFRPKVRGRIPIANRLKPWPFWETVAPRSARLLGSGRLNKKTVHRSGFRNGWRSGIRLAIIRQGPSRLILPDNDIDIPLNPIRLNAISPISGPDKGIEGPLVYVGRGELSDFEGKTINRAIVMMEFDSGKNWVNAASLGAFGLIFIDRGKSPKAFFDERWN